MTEQFRHHTDTDAPDVFWRWACNAYARPGAADSLIAAQDAVDFNVNMMLWACWTATRFEAAPDAAIRQGVEAVGAWHDGVTRSLRATRRAVSPFRARTDFDGAEALRETIKQAELDAERIEINILDRLAFRLLTPTDDGDHVERARRNLASYAGLIGAAARNGFSTTLLHQVIDHIFDQPEGEAPAEEERDPS